jgi:hypothetical protein
VAHAEREVPARHYDDIVKTLRSFDQVCGHLIISECQVFELPQWLDQQPQYESPSTIHREMAMVKRAFH